MELEYVSNADRHRRSRIFLIDAIKMIKHAGEQEGDLEFQGLLKELLSDAEYIRDKLWEYANRG